MDKCQICCREADDPFRFKNSEGEIIEGCISNFHDDFLSQFDDIEWHNRAEAKEWRKIHKY